MAELELCCWREDLELASAALLLLVWIAVFETLADEAETFVTFFLTNLPFNFVNLPGL